MARAIDISVYTGEVTAEQARALVEDHGVHVALR